MGANEVKAALIFFVIAMLVMGLTMAALIYLFFTVAIRVNSHLFNICFILVYLFFTVAIRVSWSFV